jgi:hypothetical protein
MDMHNVFGPVHCACHLPTLTQKLSVTTMCEQI